MLRVEMQRFERPIGQPTKANGEVGRDTLSGIVLTTTDPCAPSGTCHEAARTGVTRPPHPPRTARGSDSKDENAGSRRFGKVGQPVLHLVRHSSSAERRRKLPASDGGRPSPASRGCRWAFAPSPSLSVSSVNSSSKSNGLRPRQGPRECLIRKTKTQVRVGLGRWWKRCGKEPAKKNRTDNRIFA
jgi:hypothetical protein